MRRSTRLAPLVLAVPLTLPLLATGTAWADGSATGNLSPVVSNGSTGSGMAMATVTGDMLEFTLAADGLADGPHAAHIHFGEDARHECPAAGDDADGDDRLSTTEGGPAYGPIVVSLTRSGDTSPSSGLAVDRFASGASFQYMRGDVAVDPAVSDAIESGEAVVVVHGVAYTGAEAEVKSDLDPSLPASATDPAICGVLNAAPAGGAATGAGGTAGTSDTTLIGLGAAAVLAAAGVAPLVARRARG